MSQNAAIRSGQALRRVQMSADKRPGNGENMAEILIFSGTTEGRELAEALCARQIDCVASVATEYGREVMRPQEHLVIREGRMSEPEMEELMRTGAFLAVVDATHPYAVEVTEHIKESAKKTNLPYLRLSRSTAAEREIAEHEWMIHTVADTQAGQGHG